MKALLMLAIIVMAIPVIPVAYSHTTAAEEVDKARFDEWMKTLSNWGRWGRDDQLGALNLITPAKRVAAARLVTLGESVSMAREITPASAEESAMANRAPVLLGSAVNVYEIDATHGYFWERYEVEYHGSEVSHLDALCHMAYEGKTYNGADFTEVVSKQEGCRSLSVFSARGGIVTRGILIDLPGVEVTPEVLLNWEKQTGIQIGSGDAVFLRTGRDINQSGGYHPLLIPWIKERDIALMGADIPQDIGPIDGVGYPIHIFTLVGLGVHLFDNLGLEQLAQTARRLGRWEFMFVAAPHAMHNGSGAAINPIAVF